MWPREHPHLPLHSAASRAACTRGGRCWAAPRGQQQGGIADGTLLGIGKGQGVAHAQASALHAHAHVTRLFKASREGIEMMTWRPLQPCALHVGRALTLQKCLPCMLLI
eukprot:1149897-Pelagomonas_calceolata.AAC.2